MQVLRNPEGQMDGAGSYSGGMRTVAERFVGRATASAQSHPVPNFTGVTVRGNNQNTASYPDRTAYLFCGVFDQSNRLFELWFNGFTGVSIQDNQSPLLLAARYPAAVPKGGLSFPDRE